MEITAGERNNLTNNWIKTGIYTGLISVLLYLSLLAPYPEGLKRIAFFAYGVLLIPAVIGLYYFFKARAGKTVKGQLAMVFGIIAGVMVNLMAVVQNSIRIYMRGYIENAETPELQEQLRWIWRGLESVQLGMDVSWDIFILSSLALFSLLVYMQKEFGKIFGATGLLLALSTLSLNLYTFPVPPGAVYGQIWDFGPLCGLWFLAVLVRVAWLHFRKL